MPDIADGDTVEVQGSAAAPYELKNIGGVYSCSCPAWRNAGGPIDMRTCKHLKQYRGDQAEIDRVGDAAKIGKPAKKASAATSGDDDGDAPPVLLAHKWENDQDLVGWWMSEKLDGVRAWWDGSQFLSRLGNTFLAPAWFTKDLPSHPLDGELWVGRQEFQKCVSIVRRADAGDEWKQVKYLIFDAPGIAEAFEGRVAYVNNLFGAGQSPWATPVEHVLCTGVDHLKTELARVEGLGGEGLMMRQPSSSYVAGRSTTLLKVKTFHDAEGRVLAHEGGKGKHKGRLGALVVEMLDGTRFNVGTGFTDKEREDPPKVGDIITYRYQELTKDGVPRFPSYVGLAIDKSGPTAPPSLSAKPHAPLASSAPSSTPSVSSAPKVSGTGTGTTGAFRRFEMEEKFWAIKLHGSQHTVRFGKQGTEGQAKTKDFGAAAAAQKDYDRLIAEKTGKGYEEVESDDVTSSSSASSAPAPKPPAPVAKPAPAASAHAPTVPATSTHAPSGYASAPVSSAPAKVELDDGKAIHEVVRALSSAWRAKRWAEVEASLHEQAVFVTADGTRAEGRAACVASYREFLEKNRVIRLGENDHRVDVWGLTAIATCRWEMTFAAGGKPQRAKGTEMLTLAHVDGAWRVVFRRVETLTPAAAPVQRDDSDEAPDSGEGDAEDDEDDEDDDE